jgi:hypothetical protein
MLTKRQDMAAGDVLTFEPALDATIVETGPDRPIKVHGVVRVDDAPRFLSSEDGKMMWLSCEKVRF